MEQLFRKHFWVVQLAVVVVVALLLAAALNAFLGAWLTRFAVPEVPAAELADRDPLARAERPFVPDGVFGETTPPPPADPCANVQCDPGEVCDPETRACVPDPTAEPEEVAPLAFEDGRCLDSDIAINLAGTMVAADPRFSLAVLQNPADSRTHFARVGGRILDQAEVTRIERSRVFIVREGVEECLRFGDQATRAQRRQRMEEARPTPTTTRRPPAAAQPVDAAPATRARAAASQRPAGTLEERAASAIEQTAPNAFTIDRETLEEVANNSAFMQTQAPQVVPTYRDGRPNGFRLQGVRGDSLFGRLGIRNGDILQSVNGQLLDSPQRALMLYEQLLSSGNVEITIERAGRTRTVNYTLR